MNYASLSNKLVSLGTPAAFWALAVYYMLAVTWGLGWRDAPELITAIQYLDIAHPAGFPVLPLLAKPFTWLPLGAIAFRIHLFCVVSTLGALYLLYRLIIKAGPANLTGENQNLSRWLALMIALGFAVTPALWQSTLEIEAYALNLVFLALVIGCYLQHRQSPGLSWLMAGAFIYGVGMGNHGALLLYLPGLLVMAWGAPKDRGRLKPQTTPSPWFILVGVIFFCLLGLAVYVYLPLRSNPTLPLNFGSPDTWERFWSHVSDQKDRATHFASLRETGRFGADLKIFLAEIIPWPFWVLGLPLALLGAFALWPRNSRLLAGLLIIIGINSLFFITWTDGAGLLPSFYLAFLLMGIGLIFLAGKLADLSPSPVNPAVLAALTLVVILSGGWWRWQHQDYLGGYLSVDTFWAELAQAPPEALIISGNKPWFHNQALRAIYRLREDAFVVGGLDLVKPEYFNPVTKERYPGLLLPREPQSRLRPVVYISRLIRMNLEHGRRVMLDLDRNIGLDALKALDVAMIPAHGLSLEAVRPAELDSRDIAKLAERQISYALNKLKTESLESGLPYVGRAKSYYGSLWADLARYYNQYLNRPREALLLIDSCRALLSAGPPFAFFDYDQKVGTGPLMVSVEALWALGRRDEAEARMLKALEDRPDNEALWTDLARFYQMSSRDDLALVAARTAVELAPREPLANLTLARALKAKGLNGEALKHYHQAIENYNMATQGRQIIEAQKEAALLARHSAEQRDD